MAPEPTRTPSPILALVAAARVGVGAAMLLAPDRFFKPDSGTETLLMQTIGIRDLVIGSGACVALLRGGDFRHWAAMGLVSDSADLLLGLRSRPLVGTRSALIATLAPVPFVGAGVRGFVRGLRKTG
ncbi:hypothetical protein [Mycobacterium montefiorense]|uniref:hypothetical protein n=1 Tax=Mycobacterium montefiorense TaxID=154654 RepID=UPI0021DDAFF4|nr:hypothetical protein [Mycobacterium montefiorense]MCV7426824.1 hypothetical protein [Mycobacterium montefiorense]GLE53748.1 hypothetical protein ATCCBAA256_33110 [Mycobacterium montefiorense]